MWMSFVTHHFNLSLAAKCNLNGTLGSPINVKGDNLNMTVRDLKSYVTIEGHFYHPRGENQKHFKVDSVAVNIRLKGSVNFSLEHKNVSSLSSFQNNYLSEYKAELWNEIVPDLRVAAATLIRTIADKIFDNFPVKDLFPF